MTLDVFGARGSAIQLGPGLCLDDFLHPKGGFAGIIIEMQQRRFLSTGRREVVLLTITGTTKLLSGVCEVTLRFTSGGDVVAGTADCAVVVPAAGGGAEDKGKSAIRASGSPASKLESPEFAVGTAVLGLV